MSFIFKNAYIAGHGLVFYGFIAMMIIIMLVTIFLVYKELKKE